MAAQQKMVRTFDGNSPSCTKELDEHLADGWSVLFITPGNGHVEYVLQKAEPSERFVSLEEQFIMDEVGKRYKTVPVNKKS